MLKKWSTILMIFSLILTQLPLTAYGEESDVDISNKLNTNTEVEIIEPDNELIMEIIEPDNELIMENNDEILTDIEEITNDSINSEVSSDTAEITNDSINSEVSSDTAEITNDSINSEVSSDTAEITNSPLNKNLVSNMSVKQQTFTLKNENDGKLVDNNKTITDEDVKITSEYNFMPDFDNLDGIEVNGNYLNYDKFFLFNLSNNQKNSIVVTFKNVGLYNGKKVDLKLTVKDWEIFSNPKYNPELHINKNNAIQIYSLKNILIDYNFLDNLTNSPLTLSGFFNFTDIDIFQSIDLYNNTNVQNYYTTKDNQLYFKTNNDYIRIGDIYGKNIYPDNMDYWITYTYKQINHFSIRYNQETESNAFFAYNYKAPVVIEKPTDPVVTEKTVDNVIANNNPVFVTVSTQNEQTVINQSSIIPTSNNSDNLLPNTGEKNNNSISYMLIGALLVLMSYFLKKRKYN